MTTLLQSRNDARCRRLLARSALLGAGDLDLAAGARAHVAPDVLACLVYMRDVEGFTDRDLVGLAGHPATQADPLVRDFLHAWRAEEHEHAVALDRFLTAHRDAHDVEIPPIQPPPAAAVPATERALVLVTRPVGHVVTCAHMVWGAANELLTLNGYRLLARRCGNPVLAELLRRIAAQESRHYSFYALQAEWRLAASPLARRVVTHLLRRSWTPVGIGDGYKSPDEFAQVLAYLVDGADGARAVATMDQTIARLPGLGGLRIYADAAA
jgi:rubrerythrin